jgi:UDP-N-acetylmuramoyl-tripeptide--D-alanyl-D-alanine ligase
MKITDFSILVKLVKPIKIFNLYYFKPITGFCYDSRKIKRGQAFIAVVGQNCDGHDFINQAIKQGARLIIAQRDIFPRPKVPYFVVSDTYQALAVLARYVRKLKNPFVYAITGSVGKTTTKEMLSFLLKNKISIVKNYKTENNILGVSKTIFSLKKEKILILELGTNAPGEIQTLAQIVDADVGIITFIKPVHLQGLKSLQGIFKEKTALLKVNKKIKAVLNHDDQALAKINFCSKIYWLGRKNSNDIYARLLNADTKKSEFLVCDKYKLTLNTPFDGFIYNALAALQAARLYGLTLDSLVARMNRFVDFPDSRMQQQKVKNYFFLNDAYNANPFSFQQALRVLARYPQDKVAVIGDMRELGKKTEYYHRVLAKDLLAVGLTYCLAFGEYTQYTVDQLKRFGFNNVYHFESHAAIAKFINTRISPESLIFLKGSRKMELEKVMNYV